jgi:hypothetical protein
MNHEKQDRAICLNEYCFYSKTKKLYVHATTKTNIKETRQH